MKYALSFFLLLTCHTLTARQQQKKTAADLQQVAQSIRSIDSLFKKKPKHGTTPAGNETQGTNGAMPAPGDKIFLEPGGGLLCADAHGGTALLAGVLYEWGDRTYGQQGNNQATKTYLPVQVTTDNDWRFINTGGYYNLAIKTDGTLWSWGWGNYGELGQGNVYRNTTPTQVGYDTTWITASGADGHAAGIKADGTLWIWGANVDGQLGVGPTPNSKVITPMQLDKAHDWAMVATGDGYTLALKKDGSLWAWGRNQNGALGVQTRFVTQQAPIRIGHDNDWAKVFAGVSGYASFAIKQDGSLWAWGYNRGGQLGIGNVKENDQPVQVGTDHDWVTVSNRINYTVGLKADGSLWQWGEQVKGMQRIGGNNKYIAVAAGFNFLLALRNDGTWWSRGNNSDGGLAYISNPNYFATDFVRITAFPPPVITTVSKATMAGTLDEAAALLFRQSNSCLPVLDKNKIGRLLNFKLSADKKQFILDAQSADYPFDVRVYATDMNKNNVEEIFVFYGNSFTSGNTGSSVQLLVRDAHGTWHAYLDSEGIAVFTIPGSGTAYPDLVIGIPGFQYPVYRWNGNDFVRVRNISDADLRKTSHADVETLSKNLYKSH